MKWPGPVVEARLIRRYKRFLADFSLPDGQTITAHCANTGSMKTCLAEDALCLLTHHDDPKRKLKYSWQAIAMDDGWVGINTSLANALTREAIEAGAVAELHGYAEIQSEARYGERSRIDLLLRSPNRADCYVEVKNATLRLEDGRAGFPDAATQRGAKHLVELTRVLAEGGRAVLFYCVQRTGARRVALADAYDPRYAAILREAAGRGLEVYAYRAEMDREGVRLVQPLPVDFD